MKTRLLLITLLCTTIAFSQSRAIYNISVQTTWNSPNHGTLPSNAHWSDLVGATHNNSIVFWAEGQMATDGIEDVAESGDDDAFEAEVMDAISQGYADQWFDEDFSPFAAISGASLTGVEVSEDFPLLTLASMIAPSPDWMIGVSNLDLRPGGNWVNNLTIDLFPYDAGTENGFGYSTSNPSTNPQGVITNIAGASGYPFNSTRIATITIELQQVLSVSEFEQVADVKLYPNPAKDNMQITIPNGFNLEQTVIYDVLGKVVFTTGNSGNTSLNLSQLNNGIYVAKFFFDDGATITKKIIKE
ncbi:spondin domain-containing protein [Winogradskyella sp. 3972H.M.0a.05]|uniref:spondin domain-containing protein n=1 Tax=Winogradskyella sp. 3972H.M.0a.05 TaxID=2950277 RepID=UPI003390B246